MQESKTRTYLVEFNDFGRVYVVARSFSEAEKLFLESKIGGEGEYLTVKSIISQNETNEPLIIES